MSTKWLDVAFKRQKQDGPNGKTSPTPLPMNSAPAQSAPVDKINPNATAKVQAKTQGDLQSMEDIYLAAGIMNPRMGYSISKVVEMLNNDHIRGLPSDAKRAAVLMALEAAGISIDQVLRDAKMRQQALDEYETDQRKHFEEYWTRKAEANAQTQTEMERITAQCLDRMKRNLDEVAQEKAAFSRWQTMKQQEADRISEAVGLCSKPAPAETPVASLPALGGMGHSVKPS
jgi:replication initiation and membrane attachment protein DnaB